MATPAEVEKRAAELQRESEFWLILETQDGDKLLPLTTTDTLHVQTGAIAGQFPFSKLDLKEFPKSNIESGAVMMQISHAYDKEEGRPTLKFSSSDGQHEQVLDTRRFLMRRSELALPVAIYVTETTDPVRGKIAHADYVAHKRDDLRIVTSPKDVVLLIEDEDGYEGMEYLHRATEVEILKEGIYLDPRLAALFSDFYWKFSEYGDGTKVIVAEVSWDFKTGLLIDGWSDELTIPMEYFVRERFSSWPLEIPVRREEVILDTEPPYQPIEETAVRRGRVTEIQNRN